MPKERSIAKRLSGGEALDSLCRQIRSKLAILPAFRGHTEDLDRLMKAIWVRLSVHGHFHSHKGYHGYSAKVIIAFHGTQALVNLLFRPAMSYAPALMDIFSIDGIRIIADWEETIEIPVRPPNAVRTEAEMPIPIEVEEAGQIVEKFVPAAKYKGKLKPGTKKPVTANMDAPAVKGTLEMPEGAVEQYGIQGR